VKRLVLGCVMAGVMLLGAFLGAAAASQCPTDPPAEWQWQEARPAPVSGGFGQGLVGAGDHVYLLRSLYPTSPTEFHRYDPHTTTWVATSTAGLTTGVFRDGTALAWDGDTTIYALAGGQSSDTRRREFWQYSVGTGQWQRLPDTPYDQGIGNAITWSGYDDKIYAFVGSPDSNHNRGRSYFACYDPFAPALLRWSVIYPCNWTTSEDGTGHRAWPGWTTTGAGAALASAGEYIYALQGTVDPHHEAPRQRYCCCCSNEELAKIDPSVNRRFARFHIPTRMWEELPALPDEAGVGSGGSLLWIGDLCPDFSDYILALGGSSSLGVPGTGFFLYTISEERWTTLEDLPYPVGHFTGPRLAFAAGQIYYWQGERSAQPCSGTAFYLLGENNGQNEDPCAACLDLLNELTAAEFQWVPGIGNTLGLWPWGYGGSLWFPDASVPKRLVDHQPYTVTDPCSLERLKAALENVPYVGPVRAEAILRYFCPELFTPHRCNP